jgi:hypothetical protein
MSAPGDTRHNEFGQPIGPSKSLTAYEVWLRARGSSVDPLFRAIIDTASGPAAGLGSCMRIAPDNGSIEIGHLAFSPGLQRTPAANAFERWLDPDNFDAAGRQRQSLAAVRTTLPR